MQQRCIWLQLTSVATAPLTRKSGEGGIRTHETALHRLRDFQSRSLGQLGHLSVQEFIKTGSVYVPSAKPLPNFSLKKVGAASKPLSSRMIFQGNRDLAAKLFAGQERATDFLSMIARSFDEVHHRSIHPHTARVPNNLRYPVQILPRGSFRPHGYVLGSDAAAVGEVAVLEYLESGCRGRFRFYRGPLQAVMP